MGWHQSGFYVTFEALILELCAYMLVHSVCKIINEHDNMIWRLLEKYVDQALEVEDCSNIIAVGMDETSRRKGHSYITLFVDVQEENHPCITRQKFRDSRYFC